MRLFPEVRRSADGGAPRTAQVSEPNPTNVIAQVDGSGTVNAPNRPSVSPLMPSVKKRVDGSPLGPPPPNIRLQSPPGVLPAPGLTSIVPSNAPVVALKALIWSATLGTKLKLPTSKSPPKAPKPAGATAMPHGEASSPVGDTPTSCCRKLPLSSKTATAPWPATAVVCAGCPASAYAT